MYKSESVYILTLFSLTTYLLTLEFAWQFKYGLLFSFIVWIILTLRTKNYFLSSFVMVVYTMPFSNPSKINSVLAIPSYKLLTSSKEDYFIGYGLKLVNVFIVLTLIALIRDVFKNKTTFLPILKNSKVVVTLLCALGLSGVGLISSLFNSPFPEVSLVWLMHYLQLFLIAFFTVYMYVNYKKRFNNLYIIIAFSLLLQGLISLLQFSKQSSLGIPLETTQTTSVYYGNIDEANTTYRVDGTYHYHNQLAFITLLLVIFTSTQALVEKKITYLLALLFGFITIILTQSRTIWLSSIVFIFILMKNFQKELIKIADLIGKKKIITLFLVIFAGLSYVIIPRLILSTYVFYENAGLSVRWKMFAEAIEAIKINPYFGYGPGTNEYVLISLFPDGIMAIFPTAVHSALLQLILEVGILGTFLLVLPFFIILRNSFTRRKKPLAKSGFINYTFIFQASVLTTVIYYLFQPHVGTLEFTYLGIILGFGLIRDFVI